MDYRDLLGVTADQRPEEVEARYRKLRAFLDSLSVPEGLVTWRENQKAMADEAYAALVEGDVAENAFVAEPAPRKPSPRAYRAPSQRKRRVELEEDEEEEESQPQGPPWKAVLGGAALGLLLIGALAAGRMGFLKGGQPLPQVSSQGTGAASSFVPIDPAKEAQYLKIVQADPNNYTALFELGEMNFQAGRWADAISWFSRVVEIKPDDLHAVLDLGTANYNLGRPELAKEFWKVAVELDPKDAQAHYNLGFLYANAMGDYPAAIDEWEQVVRLAPDSDLARTARVHMVGLKERASGGQPPGLTGPPTAVPEDTYPPAE